MGGCPRRGQLWIQTTPWWPPADYGHLNLRGVWLRVAIEADELILSQWHPRGSILGWNHSCVTDRPQSTSLSNPEGHNSGCSSLKPTPMLDGWVIEGLVMTDPFHHYRHPGPRLTWGLFSLSWSSAAQLGTPLFCCIFLFFNGFLEINFLFYLTCWLRLLLIVCGDIESNPGPGLYSWSSRQFGWVDCCWIGLWCFGLRWV